MVNKLITALIIAGATTFTLAKPLKIAKVNVKEFNLTNSSDIQGMNEAFNYYSNIIEKGNKYLALTTGYGSGVRIEQPALDKASLKEQIDSLFAKAIDVANQVNFSIKNANEQGSSVKLAFHDIRLGATTNKCHGAPFIEKLYAGEVHKMHISCEDPSFNTSILVSYATDGTIRTFDGFLLANVDRSLQGFRTYLANVPNPISQPLSMKITIDP